jgi:hypothetical protein
MRRGLRSLRLVFDAEAMTHYGRASLVYQFFHCIGHPAVVVGAVSPAQQPVSHQRGLLVLIYPVIPGIEPLEMTELIQHNGVFGYLGGLAAYAAPTSLQRFLQRFG